MNRCITWMDPSSSEPATQLFNSLEKRVNDVEQINSWGSATTRGPYEIPGVRKPTDDIKVAAPSNRLGIGAGIQWWKKAQWGKGGGLP